MSTNNKAKRRILVVGTGGLAREFCAWFSDVIDVVGCSADQADDRLAAQLPGRRFDNSVTPDQAGTDQCVVAVGKPKDKRHLHAVLSRAGWQFPVLVHPTAIVAPNVEMAEGVVISPGVVIGTNVTIGALSYLNFQVGVGHDARIGRYVQVNPGAQLGGAVRIGDGALLGSNSALLQGAVIGEDATLGLGAVCLTRVRAGETLVGNPGQLWR
jgi:sugar O-acyltransferase (sialic acid O-acetyltransferase NeuD family)